MSDYKPEIPKADRPKFGLHSEKSAHGNPVPHGRWWADGLSPEERSSTLIQTIDTLNNHHGERHLWDSLHVGLYDARLPSWLGMVAPQSPLVPFFPAGMDVRGKARANLIRRVVDTAAATIFRNPTEIRCLTDGGSWGMQKRARIGTKLVNGILKQAHYHEHQRRAGIDSCLCRSGGFVKFWIDAAAKTIRAARVHHSELIWNDAEGEYPENLYQRSQMSRSAAMRIAAGHPQMLESIQDAQKSVTPVTPVYRRSSESADLADMIDVYEGWHLAGAMPGCHWMAVRTERGGGALVEEDKREWAWDFFPFARAVWDYSDIGWSCRPMVESLRDYQEQVNHILRTVAKAQERACHSRVWVEGGSEVDEDELTNEESGIGHYRGTPPVFSSAPGLPPEVYRHLDWLIDQASKEVGMNELMMEGAKPPGIDAAVALREIADQSSTRQATHLQRYEHMTEEAANIVWAFASQLAKDEPGFEVQALGAHSFERIPWRDIKLDRKDVHFAAMPVSALPNSSAGKLQTVTEIVKSGLLPPEEVQGGLALKMLNFPDLEKVITMEIAQRELVEMMVDEALYEGNYIAPEPYLGQGGLKLLKVMSARSYFKALQLDGVPEKHMDRLRRLMSEADVLEQRLGGGLNVQQPQANVPAPAAPPPPVGPITPPPPTDAGASPAMPMMPGPNA